MANYRVAIIQLYPEPSKPEENHERACNFIRRAASQGALLAVLPEYHLTGWEPEDDAFVICATNYMSYLHSYAKLAAELQINIVPGTIVETHPCNSCCASYCSRLVTQCSSPRLLNVAYFISSTGEILGSYQKANLWHGERPYLSPVQPSNSPHSIIATPLGPVGLLVCWDLAFPEAFRALVSQGAKIIIIPAFWTGLGSSPNGLKRNAQFERVTMQSVLMARAFENTAAILFVNVGGVEEGNLGLSQLVMPFQGSVGQPLDHSEDMALVDIDMQILEEAEEFYRVRKDMTSESWPYRSQASLGPVMQLPIVGSDSGSSTV